MNYLILYVLHDPSLLQDVLNAWDQAGVSGVTILASTGLERIRTKSALRDDLPLIPSLADLLEHDETLNRTLFTLIKSEEMIEKVKAATESVVGDLDEPNTGIMAVIPVAQVFGLNRNPRE